MAMENDKIMVNDKLLMNNCHRQTTQTEPNCH